MWGACPPDPLATPMSTCTVFTHVNYFYHFFEFFRQCLLLDISLSQGIIIERPLNNTSRIAAIRPRRKKTYE